MAIDWEGLWQAVLEWRNAPTPGMSWSPVFFVCLLIFRYGSSTLYIKDCFKYSFIPHTISQWNAIPAGDDMPQFKSQIKSVDLCHGSTQY